MHFFKKNHRSGEDLSFDPVRQGDAGTYLCRAKNNVSTSDEVSVRFDVLFEPRYTNQIHILFLNKY